MPSKSVQMVGAKLPLLSFSYSVWVVAIMDGWRGVKETWPAILVCGGSFAVTQFLTSNYIGPQLPDINLQPWSACFRSPCFLKFWKPRNIIPFSRSGSENQSGKATHPEGGQGMVPLCHFDHLCLLSGRSSPFAALFARRQSGLDRHQLTVPMLDRLVIKVPPIVNAPTPYGSVYTFNWLSATGTAILLAAMVSILVLRMRPMEALKTFGGTLNDLETADFTIGMVLAFAYIANYSGLSATLALLLAATGVVFPFFSPFLGWIGVFLTGSDTSSNALFCNLQATRPIRSGSAIP